MRHSVIVGISFTFTLILLAMGPIAVAGAPSAPPIHRYRVIPPPQPMQAPPEQPGAGQPAAAGTPDSPVGAQQPALTDAPINGGAAAPESVALPQSQPDAARSLQEFLKNPVVQLLIKAGGDQKFVASLQAVVMHPDRKQLAMLEIGFFIVFLFLRPRILNHAASGWTQIFGRIALNLGFTGVTALLLPALVLGNAYTAFLANLIRVFS